MWSTIIKAIGNVAEKMHKGASAGIEVAKSQSGGAAGNSGTTDTTMFGKAVQTATNTIKDKLASLNNNPKVEKAETEKTENNDTEGAENGAEKAEGAI